MKKGIIFLFVFFFARAVFASQCGFYHGDLPGKTFKTLGKFCDKYAKFLVSSGASTAVPSSVSGS